MKLCGFLLVVLIAFLAIFDTCVAEKVCPERSLPVETPEGTLCICSQGYYGNNCQLKVLAVEQNKKIVNETKEKECSGRWYQCLADQWLNKFTTFFKTFFKDFEKLSFFTGVIVGVFASVILRALLYAFVRLCIYYLHVKKSVERKPSMPKVHGSSESLKNGSVSIEIEKEEEHQESLHQERKTSDVQMVNSCGSIIINMEAKQESETVCAIKSVSF